MISETCLDDTNNGLKGNITKDQSLLENWEDHVFALRSFCYRAIIIYFRSVN